MSIFSCIKLASLYWREMHSVVNWKSKRVGPVAKLSQTTVKALLAGLIFTKILPPIHQPCQGCGQSYHYFWFSLDHLQAGACSGLLSPCIILSEITLLNSFWLQMNPKLHLALLVVFIAAVHSAPVTKESVLSTQVRKSLWHKILLKGRMKWTGKRGPKDAYWYCELPLTIENQIFLNHKYT